MKRGVFIIVGVVFLILFTAIVLIAGRGPKTATPSAVTLKVYAPFDEKVIYEAMGKAFLANRPNSKLEFHFVKKDNAKDYEAAVVDEIASGKGPDIWLVRNDWLGKHEGKLVSMPATLSWSSSKKVTNEQALKNIFGDRVLDQNSVGGKVLGLPLSVDSLALYVNKSVLDQLTRAFNETNDPRQEMFREYPKTWTTVEEWNRVLTQRTGATFSRSGVAMGTLENTYAPTDLFQALLYQKGGQLYDPTTRQPVLHVAQESGRVAGQDALDFTKSFSQPGDKNYSWNTTMGDPAKAFVDGKLVMMVGYSSLRKQIFDLNKDFTNYYVAPLPQQQEQRLPTDTRVDYAAYWTHVVPRTSANPDLAWEFIKYLTNLETQRYYTEQTLKPVLGQLGEVDSPKNESLPNPKVFVTQVLNAPTLYKPEWLFVEETLQTMLRAVFKGEHTSQTGIDTAAETLKKGRQ